MNAAYMEVIAVRAYRLLAQYLQTGFHCEKGYVNEIEW